MHCWGLFSRWVEIFSRWNIESNHCVSLDPKNCSKYYICHYDDQGWLVPISYSCPNRNYIFNYAGNRECTAYNNPPASVCTTINCTIYKGAAQVYPRNTQFYYFCLPINDAGDIEPVVFRCEDGWTFNGQQCVFNCPREGNFPMAWNKTAYYSCLQQSSPRGYIIRDCPEGFIFNTRLGHCQTGLFVQ